MAAKAGGSRALIIAMTVVVASFLAGVAYLAYVSVLVGRETTSIVSSAKPSTDALVEALESVQTMGSLTDDNLLSAMSGRLIDRSSVFQARMRLGSELKTYLDLPNYPGEAPLQARMLAALQRFDESAQRMSEVFAQRDLQAVYNYENGPWRIARDGLDVELHNLIRFNLGLLQVNADTLGRTWRHSLVAAGGIGFFELLLAVAATVLALRAIRAREEQLEVRAAELEMFAGRVAHDLTNPLAAVGIALQVAESRSQDGQIVRLAGRGLSSMRRLQGIVSALLAFARAGGRPTPGRALVTQVVEEQLEELQPVADEGQIELLHDNVPACDVACPRGILSVLLSNLLRNAIKYMGDGSPRRVRLTVSTSPGLVRFEVHDTGPGIAPASADHLFEAFVQGASATAGIGLGLATVKRLVEAYGGHVGVFAAEEGHGSVFWFELPGSELPEPRSMIGEQPPATLHS